MSDSQEGSGDPLWLKALQALMVVLALPFIIPVELYHRVLYPEFRWTTRPAAMEVRRRKRERFVQEVLDDE
jgi:hypothetical protein